MTAPKIIELYCAAHGISEAAVLKLILDTLKYHNKLTRCQLDKIGYIAKELECSRSTASKVIAWAEEQANAER